MRILFVLFIIFASFRSISQTKFSGYADLSQSVKSDLFLGTNLLFGASFELNYGIITIYTQYTYEGSWYENNVPFYALDKHLLGLGLKYRFFNFKKLYSPNLKISGMTELYSSYRGNFIDFNLNDRNDFQIKPISYLSVNHDSSPNFKYTYYYISTPLTFDILIGNEFRLNSHLYLNFGFGYNLTISNIGYKKWNINEVEPPSEISHPFYLKKGSSKLTFNLEAFLGFNYTFSFKKKPKTVAP